MSNFILLHCNKDGSDKDYRFVYDKASKTVEKFSGPRGKANVEQGVENYDHSTMKSFLQSKLKKGYVIEIVNSKPWMGGSVDDALRAMTDGFSATNQAPLATKIKTIDAPAKFEKGSVCPVW